MTTIKNDDSIPCWYNYDGCDNVSCTFYARKMEKYPWFDMDRWVAAKCPLISSIINDDTIDEVEREWLKAAFFDNKLLPVPDKVREYFQREAEKIIPPNTPLSAIDDAIKGKPVDFDKWR